MFIAIFVTRSDLSQSLLLRCGWLSTEELGERMTRFPRDRDIFGTALDQAKTQRPCGATMEKTRGITNVRPLAGGRLNGKVDIRSGPALINITLPKQASTPSPSN